MIISSDLLSHRYSLELGENFRGCSGGGKPFTVKVFPFGLNPGRSNDECHRHATEAELSGTPVSGHVGERSISYLFHCFFIPDLPLSVLLQASVPCFNWNTTHSPIPFYSIRSTHSILECSRSFVSSGFQARDTIVVRSGLSTARSTVLTKVSLLFEFQQLPVDDSERSKTSHGWKPMNLDPWCIKDQLCYCKRCCRSIEDILLSFSLRWILLPRTELDRMM